MKLKNLYAISELRRKNRGIFVVLEGIDGSGTTTQIKRVHNRIADLSKYLDITTTHEPWRNDEIKRRLREDADAYSSGEAMTELFIEDRRRHLERVVLPNVSEGGIVISDRYALSTYAYQGTQGVSSKKIDELHRIERIISPDVTFFLDVDYEIARERLLARGDPIEKFEGNEKFTRDLIEKYRELASSPEGTLNALGRIEVIDGEKSEEEVSEDIFQRFLFYYHSRKS